VGAVLEGMEDDYWGAQVWNLVLPTSIYDFFHSASGQYVGNDGFRTQEASMDFGEEVPFPVQLPDNASLPTYLDGKCRVYFHFNLFGRHPVTFSPLGSK
jgi:hypothetical protein